MIAKSTCNSTQHPNQKRKEITIIFGFGGYAIRRPAQHRRSLVGLQI